MHQEAASDISATSPASAQDLITNLLDTAKEGSMGLAELQNAEFPKLLC